MRSLAVLAITLGVSAGPAAVAAAGVSSATTDAGAAALMSAAFSRNVVPDQSILDDDPIDTLLRANDFAPGLGPVRWTTNRLARMTSPDGGTVSTLRLSLAEPMATPGRLPIHADGAPVAPDAYEVLVTRDWPSAVTIEGDRYNIEVSPHAGLGMSGRGGALEAGAMLTLGPKPEDESVSARLDRLGVRDGAVFGGAGRWYLFAAASGRAVGLNVLKDSQTGWDKAWSQDAASALIGDAQIGVGWRQGRMQTSLGYIHRSVKGDHMIWGQPGKDDSMLAFSLTVRPRH